MYPVEQFIINIRPQVISEDTVSYIS